MFRYSLRAVGRRIFSSAQVTNEASQSKPWEDPWKHALPKQTKTYTGVEELHVNWEYVERLMPKEVIPDLPKHESYPTPSGWRPPANPPPQLPFFVQRRRDHLFPLYLERKRDELNEKTLDFDYVELVVLRNVEGDVMACNEQLKQFLEKKLSHPVATHVDELKGRIKIKGAERSDVEAFLMDMGF